MHRAGNIVRGQAARQHPRQRPAPAGDQPPVEGNAVAAGQRRALRGLGIDEDTAAFIGPDGVFEVVGSGTVTVVDASGLTHSSMWEASRGEALTLLGLKIDVMGEGCRYDLVGRHAYPPDEHAAFCTLPNEKVTTN